MRELALESRRNRIIKAIKDNPEMQNYELAERFGVKTEAVARIRREAGLPKPPPEDLSKMRFICKTPDKFAPTGRRKK